jgi:hypothetical protein
MVTQGIAMRRRLAALLAVLLAGCAAAPPLPPAEETPAEAAKRRAAAPRPAYNLTGYPAAAREGYIDGCESAKRSAYGRKDEKRFTADAQYQMGWRDGFSICSRPAQ